MSLLIDWAMMGKHGLLPAAYQQVEYLESLHNTGDVEIPYTPQLGDGMRITVEFLSRERSGNCFHVGPGSGVRFSVRALLSGDNYIYTINMTSVTRAPIKQTDLNVWYTVEMRGDGVCTATDTATGTILGTTNNPQTTVPDGNMIYLFKGANDYNNSEMRIGEVVVTRGGADLFHLWPCYRKADSVMGYYDTVGKTFYAVTNAFAKGANL